VLPPAKNGRTGRLRKYPLREIGNAIFYQARTGCAWRLLPHDFPPWGVVWFHFRRWRQNGTLERVHDALREDVRRAEGREPTPSAVALDSPSVKTTEKGGPGATTTQRRSLGASGISRSIPSVWSTPCVHQASVQDRNGAKEVFVQLDGERYPRLGTVWADGAYQGALEDWAADVLGLWLQIVHKLQGQQGFVVLAKRWIVERTPPPGRGRRNVRDRTRVRLRCPTRAPGQDHGAE